MVEQGAAFPTAPSHIDDEAWKALCECARLALAIERMDVEGEVSAVVIMQQDRLYKEKRASFSDQDFEVALKAVLAHDRSNLLARMERLAREREILSAPSIWPAFLGYLGIAKYSDLVRRYIDDEWIGYGYSLAHGRAYYIFVEEAAVPRMIEGLDGPDGMSVDLDRHPVFRDAPIRFRSAGLLTEDFHTIEGRFEELDPANIAPAQRTQRRKDLQEHLEGISLPVLDLYVPPDHRDLRTMRGMLIPGSWHVMGVSRQPSIAIECPVLIGAPEIADEPYAFSYLTYLRAVPAPVEIRLRDIFSLAHIPDARFNIERGEEPPVPPDPPLAPRRGEYRPGGEEIEMKAEEEFLKWPRAPGLEA